MFAPRFIGGADVEVEELLAPDLLPGDEASRNVVAASY